MSYTLTGRIQSRLVATLPPLLLALGIHRWWAVELVVLMLLFGVALDICIYDRVFEYQPGWLALPLGLVELSLIVTFQPVATAAVTTGPENVTVFLPSTLPPPPPTARLPDGHEAIAVVVPLLPLVPLALTTVASDVPVRP